MSRPGRFVAALAAVVALSACGKVATDESVEQQIKSQLGADTADCPTDLEGQQGRSVVCTATKGTEAFDVRVTVTSVVGDTINFTIERVGGAAPSTPTVATPSVSAPTVDGRSVAQSVLTQLAADGKRVDEVSCPNLPAVVGASQRCSLRAGTDTYGVTVTVTSVQGSDVKFDIQVDRTPTVAPSR